MSGAVHVIEHRARRELARLIGAGANADAIRAAGMVVLTAQANALAEEAEAATHFASGCATRIAVLRDLLRQTGRMGSVTAFRLLGELRSAPCAVRVSPEEVRAIAKQWRERLSALMTDAWAGAREIKSSEEAA